MSQLNESVDDALWRAVRAEIVAYGVSRATVTSIAERAGVSRMTVYRRAGGIQQLVLDALAHELGSVATTVDVSGVDDPAAAVADVACEVIERLRASELLGALRRHDPDLLLPYLGGHFGRGQRSLTAMLALGLEQARSRAVELGEPLRDVVSTQLQARFLMQSLQTFVLAPDDEALPPAVVHTEVRHLLESYLRR
ncbi:TetR/AcrR family transcriptional regulator [Calidifontibacter terrae]